ncbi:MAG TPA: hypothetical protein PKI08_03960 [Aquaticitalea sp.]|nr:hypothetical protein [Aquaticitalea sp.]
MLSCKAQEIVDLNTWNEGNNEGKYFKDLNNNFTPYLGVWEWQNGNQTFRVTLWKVEMEEYENGNRPSYYVDNIQGHYEMVQQGQPGGSIEETVYTSQKKIGNSITDWFPVIGVYAYDNNQCGGIVYDNSVEGYPNYPMGIRGGLKLNLIQGTPLQMEWKVTLPEGMYGNDQPTEFNIPTDIILTKVE